MVYFAALQFSRLYSVDPLTCARERDVGPRHVRNESIAHRFTLFVQDPFRQYASNMTSKYGTS